MNTVLDEIGKIINNDFGKFTGGKVILTEPDPGSTTKNIQIKKKGKLFIAKFDKKLQNEIDIFPYFSFEEHLRKMSDYLLFYKKNDKLYVFICELKSRKAKGSGKQVHALYALSKFFINTTDRMLNYKKFDVEYRVLLFSSKGTKKGFSKPKKDIYDIYPRSNLKWIHLKDGEAYQLDNFCI